MSPVSAPLIYWALDLSICGDRPWISPMNGVERSVIFMSSRPAAPYSATRPAISAGTASMPGAFTFSSAFPIFLLRWCVPARIIPRAARLLLRLHEHGDGFHRGRDARGQRGPVFEHLLRERPQRLRVDRLFQDATVAVLLQPRVGLLLRLFLDVGPDLDAEVNLGPGRVRKAALPGRPNEPELLHLFRELAFTHVVVGRSRALQRLLQAVLHLAEGDHLRDDPFEVARAAAVERGLLLQRGGDVC